MSKLKELLALVAKHKKLAIAILSLLGVLADYTANPVDDMVTVKAIKFVTELEVPVEDAQ